MLSQRSITSLSPSNSSANSPVHSQLLLLLSLYVGISYSSSSPLALFKYSPNRTYVYYTQSNELAHGIKMSLHELLWGITLQYMSSIYRNEKEESSTSFVNLLIITLRSQKRRNRKIPELGIFFSSIPTHKGIVNKTITRCVDAYIDYFSLTVENLVISFAFSAQAGSAAASRASLLINQLFL